MFVIILLIPWLACIALSAFYPLSGGIAYLSLSMICTGYFLLASVAGKPSIDEVLRSPPYNWTHEEATVIRKYHLHFRYPAMCRGFADVLKWIVRLNMPITLWLLINYHWGLAIVIFMSSYISGHVSFLLHPQRYLSNLAYKRNGRWAAVECEAFKSIADKLMTHFNV